MKFDIYIIFMFIYSESNNVYILSFLNFKKFLKNYIFKNQILVNNNIIHKINKDLLDIELNNYLSYLLYSFTKKDNS
jgi:hypothetical protein